MVPYSQGLADNTVIAKVNGVLWDLDRPLEENCSLELLKFNDTEAQAVFWHSSAHILGEAMEKMYGGCLCYGPPIESGYYYDMYLTEKGVSKITYISILINIVYNYYKKQTLTNNYSKIIYQKREKRY